MADDTGALKAAYYGSGSQPVDTGSSGGSNILSTLGNIGKGVLSALGPVGSIAGSLLGGLFGSKSQSSANKANIQMQRETNELQYRMFNEANAWNEKMWNMQNEYNTPAAQASRLKEAGINPAFVFGNGSVSEAGGVSSASPPSLGTAKVTPYDWSPAIHTAVDAFMQSQMQSAQIKMLGAQERNLEIQNQLDEMSLLKKIHSLDIDNETKQQYLDFYKSTFKAREYAVHANNNMLDQSVNESQQKVISMRVNDSLQTALANSNIQLNQKQMWSISEYVAQHWAEIEQMNRQLDIHEFDTQSKDYWLGVSVMNDIDRTGVMRGQLQLDKDSWKWKTAASALGGAITAVAGFAAGRALGPAKARPVRGFGHP